MNLQALNYCVQPYCLAYQINQDYNIKAIEPIVQWKVDHWKLSTFLNAL